MTALADAPTAPALPAQREPRTGARRHAHRAARGIGPAVLLEHLTLAAAVLWWALPLTHASGGRDARLLGVQVVLLVLAVVAGRSWRWLPWPMLAVAGWLAAAAVAVCALAPTGWSGADDAASYAAAALATVACAAWARSPRRRHVLAGVVVLAGLDQMSRALLPWWGGEDPSVRLIGTFYWHNPFAAYLLPVALLGLGLVVCRQRPLHLAGWVAFPLATAGVVLSTSRATLAVLVAGVIAVGAVAVASAGPGGLSRRRRIGRWAVALGLALATCWVLPGPPLFADRASPLAATGARVAGQSLGQNGHYRLQFWQEAVAVWQQRPLTGGGYHSLAATSGPLVPDGWARSSLAHNGFLQALSDGGLLLTLPLLVALVGLVVLALRSLVGLLRGREREPLVAVAALALLASLAHSAVDFDWSYPSLMVSFALVAALLVAPRAQAERRSHWRGASTLILVAAGLAAAAGVFTQAQTATLVARAGSLPAPQQRDALVAATHAPLVGPLPATRLLELLVAEREALTTEAAHTALAGTARSAASDLALQAERARLELRIGSRGDAVRTAEALLPVATAKASVLVPTALLLAELDRGQEALALVGLRADAARAAGDQVRLEGYAKILQQIKNTQVIR